jgi:hypothetical protein
MKGWLAITAVALLLVASRAGAADCRPVTSLSEAIAAGHEFVVKAAVIRVRPHGAGGGAQPVEFSLIRAYRGAPPKILDIDFDPAGDVRELTFHPGDIFLLSTLPSGAGSRVRSIGNACTLRKLVGVRR